MLPWCDCDNGTTGTKISMFCTHWLQLHWHNKNCGSLFSGGTFTPFEVTSLSLSVSVNVVQPARHTSNTHFNVCEQMEEFLVHQHTSEIRADISACLLLFQNRLNWSYLRLSKSVFHCIHTRLDWIHTCSLPPASEGCGKVMLSVSLSFCSQGKGSCAIASRDAHSCKESWDVILAPSLPLNHGTGLPSGHISSRDWVGERKRRPLTERLSWFFLFLFSCFQNDGTVLWNNYKSLRAIFCQNTTECIRIPLFTILFPYELKYHRVCSKQHDKHEH